MGPYRINHLIIERNENTVSGVQINELRVYVPGWRFSERYVALIQHRMTDFGYLFIDVFHKCSQTFVSESPILNPVISSTMYLHCTTGNKPYVCPMSFLKQFSKQQCLI